jgi:DNA-3-methyladenine glycosylase
MNTPTSNPYSWLEQDALTVAPRLLGWELVSRAGGVETAGRIVEVEAYHGAADPASHAFHGRTPRTAPMFEAGGGVYVYLSYGLHTCLNIVCGPAGQAQAVLIRALEPTRGLETMAARRRTTDPRRLTRGPGNVGQALGLTTTDSGTRLGRGPLNLQPPATPIDPAAIIAGPRVGIRHATGHPWRFYLRGNPFVSR